MGDKGDGGVKNLKKWVTSFMDGPLGLSSSNTMIRIIFSLLVGMVYIKWNKLLSAIIIIPNSWLLNNL